MTPAHLFDNLGYPTLFLVGVLGSMGAPVPEKTILLVAGYMVWTGDLEVLLVIGLGLASALIGANLVYWLGRALGRRAVDRCADRLSLAPDRVDAAVRLVGRYGPFGVFASRFVPGVRFLANTAAGVTGLQPLSFLLATGCAALAYLPLIVGLGYLAGLRFGDELTGLQPGLGSMHAVVALAVALSAGLVVFTRLRRSSR